MGGRTVGTVIERTNGKMIWPLSFFLQLNYLYLILIISNEFFKK